MKYKIIILLVLTSYISHSQIVTTVAGNGTLGHSGNGSLAITSELWWPFSIAFDKYNDYYIGEALGSKIRLISSSGIISDFCGTGTNGYNGDNIVANTAELNQPYGITVDSLGNLFIADTYNNRIRKVDIITKKIVTIAGIGIAGFSGDNGTADSASLSNPYDLCFDRKGNLFVSDYGNYRIRKINPSGIISTVAGNGIPGYSGEGVPATTAEIQGVVGICVDNIGNVYLADRTNARVRKVDTLGIISTISGNGLGYSTGDGGQAILAQIAPERLAFDGNNNLFISCSYKGTIRRIDANGKITTIAGDTIIGYSGDNGPAILAHFQYPCGIAFDTCDNLYIADDENARIRKVSFNPACWPAKTPEVASNTINIYPNPTSDELRINNVRASTEYVIMNITGIIEQKGALKEGNNIISTQTLPPGMYLMLLTDDEGNRTIKKIVKQ